MTLDSNVVLDAFERSDPAACRLIEMHPEHVSLQVATRTRDGAILRAAPELLARVGVRVLSPREACDVVGDFGP